MYDLSISTNVVDSSTWGAANEMLYANIRPNIVYTHKRYLPLPRAGKEGENGRNCALFMLCPSQDETIAEIQSDYLRWYLDMYRWYTSDTYFREKIGRKQIMQNLRQVMRREWEATDFPHMLKYMTPQMRPSKLREAPNLIVDLGEWTKLYFIYSYKTSIPIVVGNFMRFLAEKINDPQWSSYSTKILYIPINLWFTRTQRPLGFTRRYLNNPLSILMFAAWKYPELVKLLPQDMTIILGDSDQDQFLKYQVSDFTKTNFNRIKLKLKLLKGFKWDEESEEMLDTVFSTEEEDEESDLNNSGDLTEYSDPRGVLEPKTDKADQDSTTRKAEQKLKSDNRARLINDMKRQLLGPGDSKSTNTTVNAPKSKVEAPDLNKKPATSYSGRGGSSYAAPKADAKKAAPIAAGSDPIAAMAASVAAAKPKPNVEPKAPAAAKTPDRTNLKINRPEPPTKPVTKKIAEVGTATKQPKVNPVEDLTADQSVYEPDEVEANIEDTTPIHLEDEELDSLVEDGVDEIIDAMQKAEPNALLNPDEQLDTKVINREMRKKIRTTFMPQQSEVQIERVRKLKGKQDDVLPPMPTAQQLKTKIVDRSDYSNAITTSNKAISSSKFANFDKNYTEKKLQSDIDGAVAAVSKAQVGIYVVSKEEEDTSTQLDLKKTVTYHLEDEFGNKHTVKLDLPVIIDDKYIFVNGSKLLLGHQQIMLPLVKATKDSVHMVTWYNKLILVREGVNDTRTSAVKRYLEKNRGKVGLQIGNSMAINQTNMLPSTLDVDMYAKQFTAFDIGSWHFILDQKKLEETLTKKFGANALKNMRHDHDCIPVGWVEHPKTASRGDNPNAINDSADIIFIRPGDPQSWNTLTDIIIHALPDDAKARIAKDTKASERKLLRTRVKIMKRMVPLALLCFFYEGFAKVMTKAEIEYSVVDKDSDLSNVKRNEWDILELADKYILWKRNPIWNTMFMNGLQEVDFTQFEYEDLEDKDTYSNLLANYFGGAKSMASTLMQYYDFMIADPATQEILVDHEMPTDFVELLLLGNKMLADNSYTPINDARAFRIRSNEIIAEYVYSEITSAYGKFRATQSRMGRGRKPESLNIKQNKVMQDIITNSSLTNEASVLNPILELEKARAVTPRGPRGVGKQRAMTLQKRAYDPSMLGIIGMTTSPDAKVGVNRQLTLEPNVTSTRGYVQITPDEDIDNLSNANLLTPSELLSPPGAIHDDGQRTAMSYKQSQYMLPVAGSTPVFFGNKVESVVPYHMSREFVVTAKQDGKVVEIKDGIIVVEYKDGTHDSIDTNPKMKNNASSGFYIRTQMESSLKEVGQKFKKNEVIGQDPRAFTKSDEDLGASMNIGVPIKVAILPNYDIYEDAGPITEKLSEKFTAYMAMKEEVGVPAQSFVHSIADVGDYVKVDDPLIEFDPAHEDEEVTAFLNNIRSKLGEDAADFESSLYSSVRTEYAGRISAIEVYSSVPTSELSPTLQAIVKKHTKHAKSVISTLDKYKNDGDMKYYKCGHLITQSPDVVKPDYQGRVKGVQIGDDGKGVVIFFYIEFKDIAKTGDKGSAFTALKFITSHVIPKGYEAYSEYRPNEEISTIIAPGAVLARKTPSIQVTMFANKCIIEMKRHALQMFFNDTDPRAKPDPLK